MTTQSMVVQKLIGRGFIRSRKHNTDTVYMHKQVRPWRQVIAAVGPDGSVNGEAVNEFLKGN
jgi:hypothetical protein